MVSYDALDANSKVWIYQSTTAIQAAHIAEIQKRIDEFTKTWVSHNNQLKAFGELKHQRFIVLIVDQTQAGASGCSIDKSVHFIQELQRDFDLDLFDRMTFSYQTEQGEILAAQRDAFAELYQTGKINDATIVFDNLVSTKVDYEEKWTLALGDSWHKRMV